MDSISEGITFDDVLLVPQKSDVIPAEVNTSSHFSRNIPVNLPLASAAMDTVTEAQLAITLAEHGGIGIIHKNLSPEEQAIEVDVVKRSENGIIVDPVTLKPSDTVGTARDTMDRKNISGIPILDDAGHLAGILTKRDMRFQDDPAISISEIMTRPPLVTAHSETSLEQARQILNKNKVEKLLLVDSKGNLAGLITIKDITKYDKFPNACRDSRGRLRAGAAVGVRDDERVEMLVDAGVDVVVVDTAHGHSQNVIDAVCRYKKAHGDKVDVVAGNIATGEAAQELVDAGVDAVKVGIGPGSICTTRIISGIGVPQMSAIWAVRKVTEKAGIPLIADGGIKQSGDITKAMAAGAQCCMVGGLLAGTDESPGEIFYHQGRPFKSYRGMGSLGAMVQGTSGERYRQSGRTAEKLVPEGIEGRVPAKGPLAPLIYQLIGGLRSGMGYCGAPDIATLQKKAKFIRISSAGLAESHPHDISITREAPNYRVE
ncbi:MAG: IMP dehydrogenase [Planctomycetes bacterium]|nr:IMP dehydrogenase [Planctomycetota bacterium]